MASRGVLYIKWGTAVDALLERSVASVKAIHPELPVHVHDEPEPATLLAKTRMFDLSPFDETLFLDLDTIVASRLDFAFERAQRHGVAICINECPWAKRYDNFRGDAVEYNSGVIFFSRAAKALFDRWRDVAPITDAPLRFYQDGKVLVQPLQDQASLCRAFDDTGFNPYVLPLNWNFRPEFFKSFYGPIKIWHHTEPAPAWLAAWNAEQSADGAIIKYAQRP
jgi:hypothetical protein